MESWLSLGLKKPQNPPTNQPFSALPTAQKASSPTTKTKHQLPSTSLFCKGEIRERKKREKTSAKNSALVFLRLCVILWAEESSLWKISKRIRTLPPRWQSPTAWNWRRRKTTSPTAFTWTACAQKSSSEPMPNNGTKGQKAAPSTIQPVGSLFLSR